jgi:hypothetical protein
MIPSSAAQKSAPAIWGSDTESITKKAVQRTGDSGNAAYRATVLLDD